MNLVSTTWEDTQAIVNTRRDTTSNDEVDVDYHRSLHISFHFWLLSFTIMGKITNRYWVLEGTHQDPNDQSTIDHSTEKQYGPYSDEKQATDMAKSLIQRNIDDFYHRAWVITKH
tara:strand:- start:26 stop:370 length:345 start_codon:yes stop_codon:yes gene_type:complete